MSTGASRARHTGPGLASFIAAHDDGSGGIAIRASKGAILALPPKSGVSVFNLQQLEL